MGSHEAEAGEDQGQGGCTRKPKELCKGQREHGGAGEGYTVGGDLLGDLQPALLAFPMTLRGSQQERLQMANMWLQGIATALKCKTAAKHPDHYQVTKRCPGMAKIPRTSNSHHLLSTIKTLNGH